jgi:hypothetical protein
MMSSLIASYFRATRKSSVKRLSKNLPCLKSKLLIFPKIENLEDRTVPSVTLGVSVTGVQGVNSSCGCLPPDTNGAVGTTEVVETVNTAMDVFNKSGTLLSGPSSLKTFFGGHGFTVNSLSDPVIVFDESINRYIIAILDFTSANATDFLDFAISNNASPSTSAADWTNFRHINVGESTNFADQPRLGYNADAYFVQFNMFSTSTGAYTHPQIFTIQKSDFLTGGLTTFHHDLSSSFFSVDPAVMHGAVTGGPEYFASEGADTTHMSVFRETNVLSNTPTDAETDFTVPTIVEPPAAPQPSGTVTTNDSRTINAAWRDNILLTDHTVSSGTPAEAKVRWYQFDTTTTTPTLNQMGTIDPGAGIATYFPSIDINANDTIGITYMESSSTQFESMMVAGRDFTDPAGTMQPGVVASAGTANYTGTRMGDYSGTGVDPSDGTTFWSENEFINAGAAGNWGTSVAQYTVKRNTAATVTTSVNPSVFGQSVTFTAMVAPTHLSGTPTGTVTFLDGAATLGTAALSGGTATFTSSSLSVGNHTVTVSYGGDANFNPTTSSALTQTVNKGASSITVTSPTNPSVFHQNIFFTATVTASSPAAGTPTGTVTFLDGGTSIASATLGGGSTLFSTSSLSVGNHTITASYSGDGNFNASSSAAITQTVNKGATNSTVTSSVNPTVFGQLTTLAATVSAMGPASGTPGGTVTFLDGGSSIGASTLSGGTASITLGFSVIGNHTISVTYSGDGNFNGSTSGALTQTVNRGASSTTVTTNQQPSVFGQSVTFTAIVDPSGQAAGTPTGMVTFLDGGVSIGSATLFTGGGQAIGSITTSSLSVGNHTITDSYSGDANFNSSTSAAITQTVNKGNSSTTVSSSPNPTVFGQAVTFSATVTSSGAAAGTPGGTVTFLDGAATLGTGTLSGGSASLTTSALSVGNHTITVSYGGDGNFNASTSAAITQTVNKDGTTATVISSTNPSVFGQSVTFTATVSATTPGSGTPTGAVTFNDGGTSIGSGTLSGGTASFSTSGLSAGTHTVSVSYGGDANFNVTGSANLLQTVNQAASATALTTNPPQPAVFGQAVSLTATVMHIGSGSAIPTGTVTFLDGATSLGTGTLSGGTTSITTPGFSPGSHSLTATYAGDTNHAGSSNTIQYQVNRASTSATLASSMNPSSSGQTVTFTAMVSVSAPGSGTPTGSVSFSDNGMTLGTVPLSGGVAMFSTSSFFVGQNPILAAYSGDSNFVGALGQLIQTVNGSTSNTTTTVASSENPSTYGDSVTFTATVTSNSTPVNTGTVTFLDGASTLASVAVSAGQATFSTTTLVAANHMITANYSDGASFNPSSGSLVQTVNQASLTITANDAGKNEGDTLTFAGTEFTTMGLVNGDTVTSVTLTSDGVAATAEDGSFAIVPSNAMGTGLSNYSITYVNGTLTVSEPAIFGTRVKLATVNEGDAGDVVSVASFTHANGVEPASDFTVTVNWQVPGHTADPGTVSQDGPGAYHVTAARPLYPEDGIFLIAVTINDDNGQGTVADRLVVNEPALSASAAALPPVNEGDAGASVEVATFTHAGGFEPAADFAGVIDWGIDGHHTDSATITQDPSGTYHVAAVQPTFTEEGMYAVTVVISDDTASATLNETQEVDEPVINAATATLAAVNEGDAGATLDVATFTHANGVEPATDFTATVNWGIAGHTSDAATVTQDSSGTYHVSAVRPVFFEDGLYTVAVSISEDNGAASVTETQEVDEPAISTSTAALAAVNEGDAGATVEVGTFTHANGVEPAGDFTATVNWGISGHTADPAMVAQDGSGTYHVTAQRPVFAEEGKYTVNVSISEDTGLASIADAQLVNEPAINTSNMPLAAVSEGDAGASVQVGTFTHANGVEPTTDFNATIDWSIAGHHADPAVIAQNGAGTYLVGALRPVFTEEGSYTVTLTIREDNGTATVIDTQTVNEPAINGSSATLPPITQGDPSATVEVATFTHASGVEAAGDFSATVDWGIDGHHADAGSVTLDGSGTYHVSSTRPVYNTTGIFTVVVTISEDNGSTMVSDAQVVNSPGPVATTTTLTSSANPSAFGQSVTFTATVTPNSGSETPTGMVTFTEGGATLGITSLSGGQATFTTSALSVGMHTIVATYGGDPNFIGSTSNNLTQTVNQEGSTTTITSSPDPSTAGQPVTFTIAVAPNAPGSGTPSGTVVLSLPKATLATLTLDSTGHATFTTSGLPAGNNSLNASYAGDTNFTSSSGQLLQIVGAGKLASSIRIASSQNPSVVRHAVTFTATVTGPGNTPTGTVNFIDGKLTLATVSLNASGVATFTTSSFSVGTHHLFAQYGGSASYNSSSSNVVSQTVTASTSSTLLASQASPSRNGALVNPSSFSIVVTMPATPATSQRAQLNTEPATASHSREVVDWLAASGMLANGSSNAVSSKGSSAALDLPALDRFFSDF